MPFKLLWETVSSDGKRKYEKRWTKGSKAYLRGSHEGQPYFESLSTGDRSVAHTVFARRTAEIVESHAKRRLNKGRINFAYAVKLYFGSDDPEIVDPTGRIDRLFEAWGERWLDEISQLELDELAKALHPDASPKTRNREVYTPFISVFNAAVGAELVAKKMWRRPRGTNAKFVSQKPTDDEIRLIIEHATLLHGRSAHEAFRNKAALLVLTCVGDRNTAMCQIRWKHLTLNRATEVEPESGSVYFPKTKNGEERTVPLTPICVRALFDLSEHGRRPDERVFLWQTRAGLQRMVQKACAAAGLPRFRPHDIGRHSFARRLKQEAGLDRSGLKVAGNWKTDAAVAVYEHNDNEEISKAIRTVDTSKLETPKISRTRNKTRNRRGGTL